MQVFDGQYIIKKQVCPGSFILANPSVGEEKGQYNTRELQYFIEREEKQITKVTAWTSLAKHNVNCKVHIKSQ